MPDTARILRFPTRPPVEEASRGDVLARANSYLAIPPQDRSADVMAAGLLDADVLMTLFALLREQVNTCPAVVAEEASRVFGWLSAQGVVIGCFDERDYFLGESALIAGSAYRLLGKREDTERWLDRAEAGFRHTVNPAPLLARVSYIRLTLRYDTRRHEDVIELLPSVALTFQKLRMMSDLAKCRFLEAMTLKELGRVDEAVRGFEGLVAESAFQDESALRGMALVNMGDISSSEGHFDVAIATYRKAFPLLQAAKRFAAIADLKGMLGETLRRMGHLGAALDSYREALKAYVELGMSTRTAYLRVVLSEALLEAGRPREAEWEILAALPTIDEQNMVPEGFAAVALLRESVRQRKTDPKALVELREYLRTNN